MDLLVSHARSMVIGSQLIQCPIIVLATEIRTSCESMSSPIRMQISGVNRSAELVINKVESVTEPRPSMCLKLVDARSDSAVKRP